MSSSPRDVFINCPFDDEFVPSFRALVFSVVVCGFRVRCAREMDDGSETRIEKLYRIVEASRYGIHDLSRTELDGVNNLPRFNMPLELGIFLGTKRFGGDDHKHKRCLLLDVDQYRYQKFISDLAGMDVTAHAGDPRKMVRLVRDWLATVSKRKSIPSQHEVLALYDEFSSSLPELAAVAGLSSAHILYSDYEKLVVGWLKAKAAA